MLFDRAVFFKNNNRLINQLIKLSFYLIKLKTNKRLSIQLSLNTIDIKYMIKTAESGLCLSARRQAVPENRTTISKTSFACFSTPSRNEKVVF